MKILIIHIIVSYDQNISLIFYVKDGSHVRLWLWFPFAKLLRNFCGTKRKMFLSLRISFARKNNNLRNHSQKSFRAKLTNSTFAKLSQKIFPVLRKLRKKIAQNSLRFMRKNSAKVRKKNLRKRFSHFVETLFIRQSFQRYRCETGNAYFKWGVTWNYANSPFKV